MARSSQRAASGASARDASAEPPGAPGHRRRSRSPYTNPSAFPGATDGRVTAAVKLLQDAIDSMEKQCAGDHKWIENNARRIDQIEAQVREQTREAKDFAHSKCSEVDLRLRAELEQNIPQMLAALELKLLKPPPSPDDQNALAALEAKFKARVDGLEQALQGIDQTVKVQQQLSEQHQAYLKARVDAKPGEEQTLVSYFKYLEEDV